MAVGSESGRVSVAALSAAATPTPVAPHSASPSDAVTVIYSAAGDARRPDRVTALAWKKDASVLYAGHSSGAVFAHRVQVSPRPVKRLAFLGPEPVPSGLRTNR